MKTKNVMKIFREKDTKKILCTDLEKMRSTISSIVANGMKGEKLPKDLEPSLFFKVAKKETILKIIEKEFKSTSKYNFKKKNDSRIRPAQLNRIKLLIDLFNDIFREQRMDLLISYEETSMYQLHKVICPICGKQMVFKKTQNFNIYFCENKSCDTLVSCHPCSALPAGLVSDKTTRNLRKDLHCIVERVFKGHKRNLYPFLSRMIERKFDEFHGHIGSMNATECQHLLNLFFFLEQRSKYLDSIKGTKSYYLEENFISLATHKEMQAYYICLTKGVNAYKTFATKELQQSMFEKGFFNKDMNLNYKKIKIFI